MVLAKWIASPVLFATMETNYLETNVTEIAFLNTAGTKIDMSGLADEIETKEPYKKMYTYQDSDLY